MMGLSAVELPRSPATPSNILASPTKWRGRTTAVTLILLLLVASVLHLAIMRGTTFYVDEWNVIFDYGWSPSPELTRLAKTVAAWQDEVLAYQTTGLSNGPTEAVNLLIEKIRRIGHGFRNFENYRLRLLLRCGVQWHTRPAARIRGRQPRLVA